MATTTTTTTSSATSPDTGVKFPDYPMSESAMTQLLRFKRLTPVVITGQQKEVSSVRFKQFYVPAIEAAIEADKNTVFLMGAADLGADAYAYDYLRQIKYKNVIVFDKQGKTAGGKPFANGWGVVNGYPDYGSRDRAMLAVADKIIVYLFENAATSGTWLNLTIFSEIHLAGMKFSVQSRPHLYMSFSRMLDRSSEYASKSWVLELEKMDALIGAQEDSREAFHLITWGLFFGVPKPASLIEKSQSPSAGLVDSDQKNINNVAVDA